MKKYSFFLIAVFLIGFNKSHFAQAGMLDNTFGTTGTVSVPVGTSTDESRAVAIDANGKIVIAGYSTMGATNSDFSVIRLNSNGTLDNTFGSSGKAILNTGSGMDEAYCMAIDANGKIVIAGLIWNGLVRNIGLIRLNTNGTLDNTFDGDGIFVVSSAFGEYANDITIDGGGKILLAGTGVYGGATNDDCLVVRINSNGTLDGTFGSGGVVRINNSGNNEDGYGIAVDANGKIVVAGRTDSPNDEFLVVRLTTTGTLDNTFGTLGATIIPVSGNDDQARDVVIDPSGKILVAGFTGLSTATDFCVVRLNSNGTLDNTFGTSGKVITAVSVLADQANAIALDASGNILIAGSTTSSTSGNDFAVIRLSSSGTIDNSFGASGIATVSGNASEAFGMKLDGSGKIVLAGSGGDFIAARLLNSSSTTVEEVDLMNGIYIYPSPASAEITIASRSRMKEIVIVNPIGQNVREEAVDGEKFTLNISELKDGIYQVIVKSETGIFCEKLLKQ